MHEHRAIDNEREVLRWGGLASMLGSLLLLATFVIVGVFVGEAATDPGEALRRFPDIATARLFENGLYLASLVLWIIGLLAVVRALWATLVPALFGGALGVVGLALLVAGALPHVAILPVSDLFHAPGATAADQATLLVTWRAIQGLLDAMLLAGLVLLPVALVALGTAMLGAPGFGRRFGGFTVGLGVVGLVAAAAAVADPRLPTAALIVFALIAFNLVLGWRLVALARDRGRLDDRATRDGHGAVVRPALERAG